MNTRNTPLHLFSASVIAVLLAACGSGDSGGGNSQMASTTTVSAYVTDDLGGYESVEMTLNTVQLRHTGSGRNC